MVKSIIGTMQQNVITIRTASCDICDRYDSIMLTREEILVRAKVTDMGIGAYSIVHNDHTRIVYFDSTGEYLGDTIAMTADEVPETVQAQPLPYYVRDEEKMGLLKTLRNLVFSKLLNKHLVLSITGPSRAGKTSFVRYLETLIPERDTQIIPSVPTMGRSTKRVKIGKTMLKTLDMGGQEHFWEMWEPAIEDSDAVVFILDATSNNVLEVAKAFERVIQYRPDQTAVLVILNKKDLALRGQANRFMSSGEFLALTNLKLPIPKVVALEASIFEGIAYTEFEEVPLGKLVTSFLDEYC